VGKGHACTGSPAKRRLFRWILFAGAVTLCAQAQDTTPKRSMDALRHSFLNPPAESRPMVRWWWFGTAVEKPELLRELQQMKSNGIGGAELAFVYPVVVDHSAKGLENFAFLSSEMLEAVRYVQVEARKLGLRIDLTLCSGWPYGGPATTLAEAAGRLRTVEVDLPPNSTVVSFPELQEGETLLSAVLVDGRSTRSSTQLAQPDAAPPGARWLASTAKAFHPTGSISTVPAQAGHRVALFFLQSHTLQKVKRAAVGAEGYVLDPFSHDSVATHLRAVGEPLMGAFGSAPPYAIFSDSLEAYGADWTPALAFEFRKRRGYDLIPHLAELVAGGSPAAESVRHDYGRTLTELVDENYLIQINSWAEAHHTRFRSQTYGEPAVSFSSQNLAALAEGEGPQWRAFSTLRWASSANHVFRHTITSGESFTWLHSPVFRATPLDMKAEADIDFLMGENQLIFHGWPYSPPADKVAEPGWSLYAAAALNDHNPWHPVMPAVTAYIARLSFLMRQGEPANQVAILLPTDDAWASFSPGHVSISGAMQRLIPPALMSAILSAGYNADFIDADAIDSVSLGGHHIVVLPGTDRIPVETLRRLGTWVAHGGKVIALGHRPTQDAEGKPLPDSLRLAEAITLVAEVDQLGSALHLAAIPDLQLACSADDNTRDQVGFIRRKLPSADLYLVVNTSNHVVKACATFATAHRFGEEWSLDAASISPAVARSQPINFAPYESHLFVFSASGYSKSAHLPSVSRLLADLSSDWQVTFSSIGVSTLEATLTDWISHPATRQYSGEAVYTRDFALAATPNTLTFLEVEGGRPLPGAPNSSPEQASLASNGLPNPLITHPGPGMHAFYEPPIREAALVFINGHPAGSLWHPPYRLDCSKLLKVGSNRIEIHVYNTALNAWSALPPHDYRPLIRKYGDRFQMQDLDRVEPISSGILGRIHLVAESLP